MEQNEVRIFPVEDALEMILMFDRRGIISYANASAKKRLEFENDLCGRHISEIFPNTFHAPGDDFAVEGDFEGEVQNFVAYRKNRTCFPVEMRMVYMDGDMKQYICMAIDVLEREYLNREIEHVRQEAEQAMKVKSEFVANVTHELRTPVNGILGNVKELLDGEHDEKSERVLRLIERCCGDMYKIINNILDFSKLEAGKFTLEARKFNFRNMMDYVKSNHLNKITEKGLEFFVTISPQIPEHVIADELRIVQILNNLLSNAQKFTVLGKITVEVLKTAQVNDKIELFFIVKDTGIGIDQADKDKLFQSFSQVDASISRKYGGTGLGLSISKQLVEMMGGRIEVESEKNRGSTFSFSIWVGATGEEGGFSQNDELSPAAAPSLLTSGEGQDKARVYGTKENRESLERTLSKLILCVEMENWEKAEMFMETVRQLTAEAPPDIKRVILRLKMAIQKENYEKIMTEHEALNQLLQ